MKQIKYSDMRYFWSAMLAALLLVSGKAFAAPIGALHITTGELQVLDVAGGTPVMAFDLDPGSPGVINMGTFQGQGEMVQDLTVLGLLGLPVSEVSMFTAASGGLFPGPFDAPSGTVDASGISVDMSSWFAQVDILGIGGGLTTVNQGGQASGFLIGENGFSMSWEPAPHLDLGIVEGPTRWILEGTFEVAAVPVPAAAWLFGSGLVGLIGVARRRKAAV